MAAGGSLSLPSFLSLAPPPYLSHRLSSLSRPKIHQKNPKPHRRNPSPVTTLSAPNHHATGELQSTLMTIAFQVLKKQV